MQDLLRTELERLVKKYGSEQLLHEFRAITLTDNDNICTILINGGLHSFPDELFLGERYTFYEGNLDLSSERNLQYFMIQRLYNLSKFLKSRKWRRIYLIISGHAAVCMQVKLAIYRITHIETVDWVFDGSGNYLQLELPLRGILSQTRNEPDYYFLDENSQANGDHEVHRAGCPYLPSENSIKALGEHYSFQSAISQAQAYYTQVEACSYCRFDYHRQ